jgi:hypothetical protein
MIIEKVPLDAAGLFLCLEFFRESPISLQNCVSFVTLSEKHQKGY